MADYRHRFLTEEEVYECRTRYAMGESMPELAKKNGISKTAIRLAVRGATYKHYTRVPPVVKHAVRNMKRKASPELVRKLRADRARGLSLSEISRRSGMAYGSVYKIVHGEMFKWVGMVN